MAAATKKKGGSGRSEECGRRAREKSIKAISVMKKINVDNEEAKIEMKPHLEKKISKSKRHICST